MSWNTTNPALGEARHNDAFTAAQRAARQARERLGAAPSWALAFAGGRLDPAALLKGLRNVLGEIPIVGGSTAGLITAGGGATLTRFECGLLLFAEPLTPGAIVSETQAGRCDAHAAGQRLGAALRAADPEAATILLLYDSVHSPAPLELHIGSHLVDGFHAGLDGLEAQLIGAGTLGELAMETSVVFDGREARRHSVVAVSMPKGLHSHIRITHGCYPASDFLTITRLDGERILELDGRPALSVVAERLALSAAEFARMTPPVLALALGEKQGDPFAPFAEAHYNNRLVMAADAESGALMLCEADFAVGTRIQLMDIEPRNMIDSVRQQTDSLLAELGAATPLFGLYIDCAGRSLAFSGTEEEESAPVRDLIGARCPLLGFFSGVEIAPVQGRPRPLDWTGVMAVFTRAGDAG
ncbi:MAG: FIST signal transduction protein [Halochromatium sp.]